MVNEKDLNNKENNKEKTLTVILSMINIVLLLLMIGNFYISIYLLYAFYIMRLKERTTTLIVWCSFFA